MNEGTGKLEENDIVDGQQKNLSTELMLFLELMSFVELYGATPLSRRRSIAKRIAEKFFLTKKIGKELQKPKFDFSHIVEKEALATLQKAIEQEEEIVQRSVRYTICIIFVI